MANSIRRARLIAAKKRGAHSNNEWEHLKMEFNSTCVRCMGKSGLVRVEKDHIKPIYQGGDDSIKNIQPLCARCNSSKGPENIDWKVIRRKEFEISLGLY